MENLLQLLSTTQSALKRVNMKIDTPVVAVLGSQSAGKSSVLESMIGLDLLPKKSGLCTRVPLELTLIHDASLSVTSGSFSHLTPEENLAFSTPDEATNLEGVREEIARRTDELTQPSEILDRPIFLVVRSSRVSNLRLIDLPGVTKISTAGQDARIVGVISSLVKKYISPAETLILAVSPANMDLANSDSLGLAREADPRGERTVGVLTKLDLMDKGTDCLDVLENRVHALKHGYVPVVNRSQHALGEKTGLEEAKRLEEDFFRTSVYSKIRDRAGSRFLTASVSELLVDRIKAALPGLRQEIDRAASQLEAQIDAAGVSEAGLGDREVRAQMAEMSKAYCDNIRASLDGTTAGSSAGHKEGDIGARLRQREAAQKERLSASYSQRIDGHLKVKKGMMYHNRYVVSNNGSLSWFKSSANLSNPKTYDLAGYDVAPLPGEPEVFVMRGAADSIHFRTESEAERDRWVSVLQKGRTFLSASGKSLFSPSPTPGSKKGRDDKKGEKERDLRGLTQHLLAQSSKKNSSGSIIKLSYLMEFIPALEKDGALEAMLAQPMARENSSGYHFLPQEMSLPHVFGNLVYLTVASMERASLQWLGKVEAIFSEMIRDCLPAAMEKHAAFRNRALAIAHAEVKKCVAEVRSEAEYDFALNAENVNCNDFYFLRGLPEKPSIDDYLRVYITQFKIHVVDLVWKLIMVLLIKRVKDELREILHEEIYGLQNDEVKSLFQIDPVEAERIRNLKKTLKELREVSDELAMINL